jgi:hypothetical protein
MVASRKSASAIDACHLCSSTSGNSVVVNWLSGTGGRSGNRIPWRACAVKSWVRLWFVSPNEELASAGAWSTVDPDIESIADVN